MEMKRILLPAIVAGTVLLAGGCGDGAPPSPTANRDTPQRSVPGWLTSASGLLSCSPLPYDSVTVTIGPSGGSLQVGPQTLVVPAGALAAPTTITAVVPSDSVDVVEFQPVGLQFQQPAQLTMSYANCGLLGSLLPPKIGYVNDLLQLLEYVASAPNPQTLTVTGQVWHFSGYAVAW
jgi:hypothetical protein